jgi:hypothetical protein
MIIAFLLIVVYIVIQLVFFNKSTTMGKAALGMQVVSSTNGEPIGFWKMLFREWIVKKASEAIFLLGYIWVLIDEKNRGWHDKILDTYVVDLKESAALAGSRRQAERPYRQPDPAAAGANAIARPAPKSAPVTLTQAEKEPDKQEYIEVDDRAASVRETVMAAADSVAAAADTASEVTVTSDTAATTAPQESMNDNSPENAADDLPESTETESTDVSDENEKQ